MGVRLKKTKNNLNHQHRVIEPQISECSIADIKKYIKTLEQDGFAENKTSKKTLPFIWYSSFPKKWYLWGRKATGSQDVAFEIGCQRYNQAVIERQLAFQLRQEDPLKAARLFSSSAYHFRCAASSITSSSASNLTADIRPTTLKTLSLLSDSDAQETAVDAAILEGVAEDVKAEIAQKASWLFADLARISPSIKWLKKSKSSILAKSAEMAALAQKFQARVCEREGAESTSTSSNKRGEAIARLLAASEGISTAERKSGATAKTRAEKAEIESALKKVKKENKLIYNEKIPKFKEVDEIGCRDWKSQFLWEDPDFTPSEANLDHSDDSKNGITEWRRPFEIAQDPKFVVDGFSRFDVHQGVLGDCWFLASLASLANHPEAFTKTVPSGQEFGKTYEGRFIFNLWWKGNPMRIEIDDRLPVINENGTFHLRYVKLNEEFWPALIEKAVAKVLGGYQFLDGGLPMHALEILTGGKVDILFPNDYGNERAVDELFQRLHGAREKGCIMTCGIHEDPHSSMSKTGLRDGHAYSLTDVTTVALMAFGSVNLLRIRNPWGETSDGRGEWKKKWSDKSIAWKKVSAEEKQRICYEPDNDGEFWMDMEDFCKHFSTVSLCKPR